MLNHCTFIGRIGKGVEIRHTHGGKAVASFSLACSEKRGDNENTEWVNVVAWERLAEICGEYLTKGSLVYIAGRMQTRNYDDKDGKKRYVTEVIAREMKMLPGRPAGDQPADEPLPPVGDDVPF